MLRVRDVREDHAPPRQTRVGMAEMYVGKPPETLLTTVGSCIAVCLYDRSKKIGGMAHIVLPSSERFGKKTSPFKFADSAVPALLKEITSRGAARTFIIAKIAGGANMFPLISKSVLNIGQENISTIKATLLKYGVKLAGEDVGGTKGRKIEFEISTGSLKVEKLNGEVKII